MTPDDHPVLQRFEDLAASAQSIAESGDLAGTRAALAELRAALAEQAMTIEAIKAHETTNLELINDPHLKGRILEEILIWVSVPADAGEGMIAADMPIQTAAGLQMRHMPLLSSNHAQAQRMRGMAERVARAVLAETGKPLPLKLLRFIRAGEVV